MKPLKTTREWPTLAVYDLEATDWVNIVLCGHVDELGNRKAFTTVSAYLDWLFREYKGDHVWAHWGGHYDHRFVIAEATKRGWAWETVQSGNMLIIVSVYHPSGRVMNFCESARLLPGSVKKIGKTVGLEKLDVDRSAIEKLTLTENVTYCLRDCDIVLQGLAHMRDVFTSVGGDFAYTLASIASRWVRRSNVLDWKRFYDFMGNTGKWEYSEAMLKADEFCLPAYFGGRTEALGLGLFQGPLYYYDFRSSYPWSMQYDLPGYFTGFHPPGRDVQRALSHCGVSEATVDVPADTYLPVLPVRHQGKLVFPVGRFRGRWTNLELEAARQRGCTIELHGQARFEPLPFLRPFVDTFYELRKKALEAEDPFRSYAYKICLNSLYGKLIEAVDRKSILYGRKRVNRALSMGLTVEPTPTAGVYAALSESEGPFRHVAAGAYVTARSRLRLLEGLELARRCGGRVYYCDTDSIVTDVKLPRTVPMLAGDELGTLQLEMELSELQIMGPKVYRAITAEGKHIYRCKGVPIKRDGDSEADSRQRWDAYIGLNQLERELDVTGDPALRAQVEQLQGLLSREGISGFMTDINAGRISPIALSLCRVLRHRDTKRAHHKGDSAPLSLSG